jgi:cystathionine beta-lyase family protein involved in aluminum resistance
LIGIEQKWIQLASEIETEMDACRNRIHEIVEYNQVKVLQAMQRYRLSDFHFASSTGYGYNDSGREVLDQIYADVFATEAALVRPHFVSGTHTIAAALFGVLRPGDECLFITGKPYDTLQKVMYSKADEDRGSLEDWGVVVQTVELTENHQPDWERIEQAIHERTKVIAIQRSRGYEWRSSFSIAEIKNMVQFVRSIKPDAIVFVDNCYGEFTERQEPSEVGVDLLAGSLIKNPGGGIATTGGYVAGKKSLVNLVANRLTAPGIGADVGATLGTTRGFSQGLFMAPHIVGQALLGSVFAARLFERCGYSTSPDWQAERSDLIQAIRFPDAQSLLAFVQAIQSCSPVDSHVIPEPWDMPGYEHPVVMAAGTFVQGGSLELSADAPIRPPFIGYLQGGLTYAHVKYAVMTAISKISR